LNRHIISLEEQLEARLDTHTLVLDKPEEFSELAGILLEYPVIYTVSRSTAGHSTYLDGIPLTLIKVSLRRPALDS